MWPSSDDSTLPSYTLLSSMDLHMVKKKKKTRELCGVSFIRAFLFVRVPQ